MPEKPGQTLMDGETLTVLWRNTRETMAKGKVFLTNLEKHVCSQCEVSEFCIRSEEGLIVTAVVRHPNRVIDGQTISPYRCCQRGSKNLNHHETYRREGEEIVNYDISHLLG